MSGWSDTETISTKAKRSQLSDEIDLIKFPENEYKTVRLVGPITSYVVTWNEFKSTKESDKTNKFPKYCLDYSSKKGKYVRDICPYRKAGLYMTQRFITNILDRDLLDNPPKKSRPPTKSEKKSQSLLGSETKYHLKEKGSKTFTPYLAWDLPGGVKDKIVSLTDLYNKKRLRAAKGKKIKRVELSDPVYGCDILVKFNPKAKGAAVWDVQLDTRTKLSEDELKYPLQNISDLKSIQPETEEEANKEWARLKDLLIVRDKDGKIVKNKKKSDDDDDDTDFEETDKKKDKKKSSKSNDDPPWDKDKTKKKKNKSEKTAKSSKSSKSKPVKKKKKKKSEDFDEDFDF